MFDVIVVTASVAVLGAQVKSACARARARVPARVLLQVRVLAHASVRERASMSVRRSVRSGFRSQWVLLRLVLPFVQASLFDSRAGNSQADPSLR